MTEFLTFLLPLVKDLIPGIVDAYEKRDTTLARRRLGAALRRQAWLELRRRMSWGARKK